MVVTNRFLRKDLNTVLSFNSVPIFNVISTRFTRLFNRWQFHYLYIILNSRYSLSNISYNSLNFMSFLEHVLYFDSFSYNYMLGRKSSRFRSKPLVQNSVKFLFDRARFMFPFQALNSSPVLFILNINRGKPMSKSLNSIFSFKLYTRFYFSSLFREMLKSDRYDGFHSILNTFQFGPLSFKAGLSIFHFRIFLFSLFAIHCSLFRKFLSGNLMFILFSSFISSSILVRSLNKLKRVKGFFTLIFVKKIVLLLMFYQSRLPRFLLVLIQFFAVRYLKLAFFNLKKLLVRSLRLRHVSLVSGRLFLNIFFDHWLFNRVRTFLIKKGLGLRVERFLFHLFRDLKSVSNMDPFVLFSNVLFKTLLPMEARQTKLFGKLHLVPHRIRMRRQLFITLRLLFSNFSLSNTRSLVIRLIDCLHGRGELLSAFNKNVKLVLENRHLAISFMRRREKSKLRSVNSFKYSSHKRNKYLSMLSKFRTL